MSRAEAAGIRTFWLHLALWAGAVVLLSLLAGPSPTLGVGLAPRAARLVQRSALGLTIGAYPAAVAAARHVLAVPGAIRRFLLLALLPLGLGAGALVGYGIPAAARADHPDSPFARLGWPQYYYFHELPAAAGAFQARADSAATSARPELWARDRALARYAGRFRPEARAALALGSYQAFTVAFALLPCLLALLGLLVAYWSALAPPRWRRLFPWLAALLLLVAFQADLAPRAPYLGAVLIEPWQLLVRRGPAVLLVPLVALVPLAWTALLRARRAPS